MVTSVEAKLAPFAVGAVGQVSSLPSLALRNLIRAYAEPVESCCARAQGKASELDHSPRCSCTGGSHTKRQYLLE